MYAAASDVLQTEVVKLLIDRGANVNAKSRPGETPLSIAKLRGNTPIVDLLIRAGATSSDTAKPQLRTVRANTTQAAVQWRLVAASRDLPIVRGLLAMTNIPLVRIEQEGEHHVVLWSDARMCSARRCDVAFGGVFGPDGIPISQIIRVGGFQQIRPLPPG